MRTRTEYPEPESRPRAWIVVASREHVQRGLAGGFAQACHGRAAPVQRMRDGDWIAFYSPTEEFGGPTACRRFTAIGRVRGDFAYPVDMGGGFVPHRRNVEFLPAREADIVPLLPELSFIPNPRRWGFPFRRGHFEIPEADMARIRDAMDVAGTTANV